MKITLTYCWLLFLCIFNANAQTLSEKGVPPLQNYSPKEYNYQGKVWSIDSAPNQILYLASDQGLLEFDGEKWKSYKGSDGIIRSVLVINDSLIYTGSDLDFGVWKRNEFMDFEYTSLYPFREELAGINEEFWNTYAGEEGIYFVSASNIYVYKDENLTKIPAPNRIQNSFFVNDTLYFWDEENALYHLVDLAPEYLADYSNGRSLDIIGMYRLEQELYMVSRNSGLFKYSGNRISEFRVEATESLVTSNVFSFQRVGKDYLAFGTILNGLIITNLNGEIIHLISKAKGLQNNTILSLHYSTNRALWMGLDYGVTKIEIGSEFTFFYDYQGGFGTGYSALLNDGTFYLGTNQGLYKSEWTGLDNNRPVNEFELINGSEGQVWTVEEVGNSVLIGHDKGLLSLRGNQIDILKEGRGVWDVQLYNNYLLAGTYNGIWVFIQDGNSWKFLKQMDLIVGSSNQVIIYEDTLWVNIPNFGVIKSELDEDLNPIGRQIFLKEEFGGGNHSILLDENELRISTGSGEYVYNPQSQSFNKVDIPEERQLIFDSFPQNRLPIPITNNYEFYSVYNGFGLRKLDTFQSQQSLMQNVVFRRVEAFDNEGVKPIYNGADISYKFNNLRIQGIVPNKENVLYQYSFENEEWSDWMPDHLFELIDIDYGNKILLVRGLVDGMVTPEAEFNFRIAPPWYHTVYAYALYVVLFFFFGYMLFYLQKKSLEKLEHDMLIKQEKSLKKQEKKYREYLRKIEEKNFHDEYEELKSKLKNKTIELATQAKENKEKNEVLETLRDKLDQLEHNPKSIKTRTAELRQIIDAYIESEDKTFEIQMDALHQDLFKKLKLQFPDLTNNDLRLCAYLKTGFNSKEIADLLNIKPSSVYISRSRLRKKLDLDTDSDLHGFLNSI